jgi:hypothetical protein
VTHLINLAVNIARSLGLGCNARRASEHN